MAIIICGDYKRTDSKLKKSFFINGKGALEM